LSEAALAAVPISAVLRDATRRLAAAGCDTPRLDAEVLLAFALGVGRERLVLDGDRDIDPVEFDRLLARRTAREPVAYITGARAFRRISLRVDPRVLIPRPETELLVDVGLSLPSGARVADVGTGSGAVALALIDERPDLDVWATDVSADAVAVARANGLVNVLQSDLLSSVPGRFDAVLANLPYVASDAQLPPEIADYEPAGALYAGPDGLAVIRRLITAAPAPVLGLEIGFDQADAVDSLLRHAGYPSVERLRDLAGHERVIVGRRT
jgi:release factor glutamine methyltransferase